jgi:type IV pilus assembly protein PilO
MARSFESAAAKLSHRLRASAAGNKDPRVLVRLLLGVLLGLNLIAALFLFKPWGGSPEDLARQLQDLQQRVVLRQANLARTKALVAKVEKARAEGDQFLAQYVMNRRTASSTIVSELSQMAHQSGLKPKEAAFEFEPIEGSDTLTMMTVSAGYEGAYQNVTQFLNLLDRSPRFLIIESLQASPQQTGAVLNVGLKFNAFVRESGPAPPGQAAVEQAALQPGAAQ